VLLRDEIEKTDLNKINIEIEALGRVVAFYEKYEEENGAGEYTTERLIVLNNRLAEYLIAGQIMREAQG
tara:strand:- start:277 stop:483 length:207 start_codon:yes stop_codon:yes gene_type:complete